MKEGIFFIAPPGARHKKEQVFGELCSQCPDHNYSSVLYIGPNNFVLSAAKSRFHSFLKDTSRTAAYIPFQSMTIKQLAGDLHEKHGERNVISDHIRTLILCKILGEQHIGYARILSDLLRKTRHYLPHKTLLQVKDDVRHLIFEEKAADRAAGALDILRSYESELEAKNILDPEDVLKNSISLISEHMSPAVLVIDGFYDPTPLEIEIIGELFAKAEKVFILAEEGTVIFEYIRSLEMPLISRKQGHTSQRKTSGYYSYPSMEDEVEGIARNIKKLIIEGINPWEITLCFPVLSKYLPMTRRIFKRHGIPASIGEFNLSATGPMVALNELITCIEEDYPRTDFLSFLTAPCFPGISTIVKERAVSLSYRAGIVQGKDAWLSIKGILLNSMKEESPKDEIQLLDEFQKGLNSVIDLIDGLKKETALLPFIDAFESALDRLGFFDSSALSELNVQGDELPAKISRQLSELRQFAGLYNPANQTAGPPSFYLKYLLQDLKGSEKIGDGVKILPFELAAGCEATALFFGGMLEGDFPSRPAVDPILPEKVKKVLGMPHLEYYLKRQRAYFKRLINMPVHEPFISCPSADGDKVFLPSPFLDWENPMNPPNLNIYTDEEVLIREGAARHTGNAAAIFADQETFPEKNSLGLLDKRINTAFKGAISVTAIDYYRKCPLRFYIEKVLRLEVETPPKFEVESRLWGNLAHKTMEYLFKDGDIEPDLMDEKLFRGLEKSLVKFPIGDFWSKVAKEIFLNLLPALKKQETGLRMQGFIPKMVEEKLEARINGLKLKGKIDRIDSKKSEEQRITDNGQQKTIILLDYKTGAIDSDSLQMPLYAGIWQATHPESVEKTGYYSLKDGRIDWFPKKTGMEEFVQSALETADVLVRKIKEGIFAPEPFKDSECRYCYHSPLCNTNK